MPEINPYESPQSDASESVPALQPEDNDGPAWVETAVNAQLGFIVLLGILFNLNTSLFDGILGLCIVICFLTWSIGLLVAAIYYRIIWLLIIELIVIGLPLKMLFT